MNLSMAGAVRCNWCGMKPSNSNVIYSPRSDATPGAELTALAVVYKFVLDCHAKKRGRLPDKSGPDDAKGSVNDRAKDKYTG